MDVAVTARVWRRLPGAGGYILLHAALCVPAGDVVPAGDCDYVCEEECREGRDGIVVAVRCQVWRQTCWGEGGVAGACAGGSGSRLLVLLGLAGGMSVAVVADCSREDDETSRCNCIGGFVYRLIAAEGLRGLSGTMTPIQF